MANTNVPTHFDSKISKNNAPREVTEEVKEVISLEVEEMEERIAPCRMKM